MNILKALHELKDTRSISTEYGVLTRYDSEDMASYTLTWRDGSVTCDIILREHMNNPAFILELIWGLEVPYAPSIDELMAWLERYRFEQPSMLVGMELQKIAKFILERKPEPAYRAFVCNRLFEYIFNHKEVQK